MSRVYYFYSGQVGYRVYNYYQKTFDSSRLYMKLISDSFVIISVLGYVFYNGKNEIWYIFLIDGSLRMIYSLLIHTIYTCIEKYKKRNQQE